MANNTWIGGAPAVAQIWKGTVTDTTTGHTYTLPVSDEATNSVTFSYTVVGGDTTVTILATSIAAAWNASTDYRLTPVTASNVSGQLVLTADVAGVPFRIGTPAGTGAWTGTSVTTANAGPNAFATAANWDTSAVPVSNDTIITGPKATADLLYDLNQSALTGITVSDYAAMPNAIGQSGYGLRLGNNATFYIGQFSQTNTATVFPSGSGRKFFDNNTATGVTAYVFSTPSTASSDAQQANVRFIGGGSGGNYYIIGLQNVGGTTAIVDIAAQVGQTATIGTLDVTAQGAIVNCGSGLTVTSVNGSSGSTILNGGLTTLTCASGAKMTVNGTGNITTVNAYGSVYLNNRPGSGVITTTLNLYDAGLADLSGNPATGTITTTNVFVGTGDTILRTSRVAPGHITFTNQPVLNNGGTRSFSA